MQSAPGPRPYDVTTRQLIDRDPVSWLAWIGLPPDGPVEPIDSEVSTALAEVDKVLRVDGPNPWLAHIEIQASRDPGLPLRLTQYHVLLLNRNQVPVASVVILLRPDADGPELSGTLERHDPFGEVTLSFRYRVTRLWERPVGELLSGGLGILPLAPLAAFPRDALPTVVERMAERVQRDLPREAAREFWSTVLLLMGLRYDDDEAREVTRQMNWLRESSTYRAIVEEGRAEGRTEGRAEGQAEGQLREARRFMIRMATRKLGPPDARAVATIEAITDVERLEQMGDRLLSAESWDELLAPDTRD